MYSRCLYSTTVHVMLAVMPPAMKLRGCPSTWPHYYGEHWSHLTRPTGAAFNVWHVFGENPPQCSVNGKRNKTECPMVIISEHQIQNVVPFPFIMMDRNVLELFCSTSACYNSQDAQHDFCQQFFFSITICKFLIPDSHLQHSFPLKIMTICVV